MISLQSFDSTDKIVNALTSRLIEILNSRRHVLWLLSGGSNLETEKQIINNLPESLTEKLTIGLIDERFGDYNHGDSNFFQLKSIDPNFKKSSLIEVIDENDDNLETTTHKYRDNIQQIISDQNTYVVGQLGLGNDGHIAGLLPNCPILSSQQIIDCYASTPFKRISFTPAGLKLIDQLFLVVNSTDKNNIIDRLLNDHETNISEFPAQILNQFEQVQIYNIKEEN